MRYSAFVVRAGFVFGTVILLGSGCVSGVVQPSEEANVATPSDDQAQTGKSITRSEAIDQFWYQISRNVTGTESVRAYSATTGNTYTLDADISYGFLDTLSNGEGDTLTFTAEIHEDGTASGTDQDGNTWDFTIDMNSPIMESAVQSWAKENGYVIE